MKKYLIAGVALSTSLFAANNAKIIDFFKNQVPKEVKIEVVKSEKLKQLPKFELVTIKLSEKEKSQEIKMFYQDGVLIPEIINLKTKKPMMAEIEKASRLQALKRIYSKESENSIIKLGNDPKKETLVIFTDPECPYCRKELGEVEKRLEKNNLKLVLTTVHGESALKKCSLVYKHMYNAKNDEEKIKILRKYYSPDVNITGEQVSKEEVEKMLKFKEKYMNSGAIKGVPAVFKEKDIK